MALVTNYSNLVSAEQRITALTPENETEEVKDDEKKDAAPSGVIAVTAMVLIVAAAAVLFIRYRNKLVPAIMKVRKTGKNKKNDKEADGSNDESEN